MENDEKCVKWSDVLGYPYSTRICCSMLLFSDGYVVIKNCILRGSPKPRRSWKHVTYDASYVEAKIKTELLDPLGVESLEQVQKLIDRAKRLQMGDNLND